MADVPLINGRRYAYASLEISVIKPDGSSEIFIDINEISYSEALTIAFVQGTAKAPIGWTEGTYEPGDATLRMGKSSFQSLIEDIGDGWLGANVKVVAKYADDGEPLTTDELTSRIAGAEDSHSYGPDPLGVNVTLKTIRILRNGISPIKGL